MSKTLHHPLQLLRSARTNQLGMYRTNQLRLYRQAIHHMLVIQEHNIIKRINQLSSQQSVIVQTLTMQPMSQDRLLEQMERLAEKLAQAATTAADAASRSETAAKGALPGGSA